MQDLNQFLIPQKRQKNKALYSLLFALCWTNICFAGEVILYAKIDNAIASDISVSYGQTALKREGVMYKMPLKNDGSVTLLLELEEAQIVQFKHGTIDLELYVKGGDYLDIHLNGNDNGKTATFKHTAGLNTQIWHQYRQAFPKGKTIVYERGYLPCELDKSWIDLAKSTSSDVYYEKLEQSIGERLVFLKKAVKNNNLSNDFAVYLTREIEYKIARDKLTYFIANGGTITHTEIYNISKKHDVLLGVKTDNDAAINHPSYTDFLMTYASYIYQKDPIQHNEGKPFGTYLKIKKTIQGEAQSFLLAKQLLNAFQEDDMMFCEKQYPDFARTNPAQKYADAVSEVYSVRPHLNAEEIAPGFVLQDTNGNMVRLSDYKGKVVYISFWATWCHVCLRGYKNTEATRKELKEKGVILLNISLDAKEDVWRRTLGRVNIPGINLWAVDEQKMRNLYYVNALPAYFIVNKKGQFTYLPEYQRDVVYEFEKLIKE